MSAAAPEGCSRKFLKSRPGRRRRPARMLFEAVDLPHLRLGLLQPEPHVHLAVLRHRRVEVFSRRRALARAPVELAETEAAVGDKGAHAVWLGELQRAAITVLAVGLTIDLDDTGTRDWRHCHVRVRMAGDTHLAESS